MKKIATRILAVLFGILLLAGALVLLINLYLQSPGVQAKVQRSLTRAFDLPVQIQTISFTPPRGLKLTGILVPAPDSDDPAFLKSARVTVRFRLSPLFRNRFIIEEVIVEEPVIYWAQNTSGHWKLPTVPEDAPPEADTSEGPSLAVEGSPTDPVPPDRQPPVSDTPAPSATPSPVLFPEKTPRPVQVDPKEAPPDPRFEVQIKHFLIKKGKFDLREKNDDPFTTLTGITIEGDISTKNVATGTASSRTTRVIDNYLLENLTAQFKLSPRELELRDITAEIGEGNIEGRYDLRYSEEESPYSLTARFSGVQLASILEEAGGPASKVSGQLAGSLVLRGSTKNSGTTSGKGQLVLTGGSFKQYGVLQLVGDNLGISELSKLELHQATAAFRVEESRILVDDLTLKSPNLEIKATGTIHPGGELELEARLTVNTKISRQLPEFVEDNFTPVKDTDFRYLNFTIAGTLDNPETDLVRLMLWKRQEDAAVKLFKKLFGDDDD